MRTLRCTTARWAHRPKTLRAERDWSRAELAERLDVSRQTVNAVFDPGAPVTD